MEQREVQDQQDLPELLDLQARHLQCLALLDLLVLPDLLDLQEQPDLLDLLDRQDLLALDQVMC